jgi:hypothetical protein
MGHLIPGAGRLCRRGRPSRLGWQQAGSSDRRCRRFLLTACGTSAALISPRRNRSPVPDAALARACWQQPRSAPRSARDLRRRLPHATQEPGERRAAVPRTGTERSGVRTAGRGAAPSRAQTGSGAGSEPRRDRAEPGRAGGRKAREGVRGMGCLTPSPPGSRRVALARRSRPLATGSSRRRRCPHSFEPKLI